MPENLLISIKPPIVEAILDGRKTYEYRKYIPAAKIKNLVIYSTYPVQRIVAVAEVLKIRENTVSAIWEGTQDGAGVSFEEYQRYFAGKTKAYAFKLGRVFPLPIPIKLSELDPRLSPPQSYSFLDDRLWEKIEQLIPQINS